MWTLPETFASVRGSEVLESTEFGSERKRQYGWGLLALSSKQQVYSMT